MTGDGENSSEIAGDEFDALLLTVTDGDGESPTERGTAPPWLLAAVSLAVIGALVILSSVVLPSMLAPMSTTEPQLPAAAAPSTQVPTRVPPKPAVATVPDARPRISVLPDQAWLASTARATDIPDRALAAYAGAAIELGRTHPDCSLGWNTLAAIGSVESEHGTIHGSALTASGVVAPSIVGEALTGERFDHIADTDAGALDVDGVWDRAVGPMQFIPSTWAEWGADGSGDGVADPQNIDDSTLAAGRYLCGIGADLSVSQNWLDAIWAYNGTTEYVTRVSEMATIYATAT